MTVVDEWCRVRPAPALRRHVAAYSGWRQEGSTPGRHLGLPSPWLTFIVTLDDPLLIAEHPDPAQPAGTFVTLVGGLHTRPAVVLHPGRQSGVQLELHPLGARALLGVPAGALAGLDLDAADVLGPLAAELQERVRAAPGWPQRMRVLDEVLTRRLLGTRTAAHDPELVRAWALLDAGSPVAAVAADVGWSTRRLTARFADEVGLSPQTTARLARFHRARRRLQAHPATGLAELAVACGFYDQAHLTRDFQQFTGLPPRRWLAAEEPTGATRRSVQDADPEHRAGSRA